MKRAKDFQHVVRTGHRVGGAYCLTYAVLHTPQEVEGEARFARFGIIVSKQVGNAVTRNLVRRRVKAIIDRHLSSGFEGADVVFRMFHSSAEASFNELLGEVDRALNRVRGLVTERQ